MRPHVIIAALLVVGLSACGTTTRDRAITGGALGAGAGAAGALVTGGSVATGAVLGGLVGAAAGGLTNAEDINLGEPVYNR